MPKKIKDTEYAASTMRIRALERGLLNAERLERMLDAKTAEDAAKVASECGYGELIPLTAATLEKALASERAKLYDLLTSIAPDKTVLDVFRIRYDYHNAKVLAKAEALNIDAARLLLPSGRYSAELLTECFTTRSYKPLSAAFGAAIEEARSVLGRTTDPQKCDMILDRAAFEEMAATADAAGSAFVKKYVSLLVSSANLRTVVRAVKLGRDEVFLGTALFRGGAVNTQDLAACTTAFDNIPALFPDELKAAALLGVSALKGEAALTAFEKKCDDSMVEYLRSAQRVPFGEQPLVAYLAAREAEMVAIRTILTGRLAGVPVTSLRERLRESYV